MTLPQSNGSIVEAILKRRFNFLPWIATLTCHPYIFETLGGYQPEVFAKNVHTVLVDMLALRNNGAGRAAIVRPLYASWHKEDERALNLFFGSFIGLLLEAHEQQSDPLSMYGVNFTHTPVSTQASNEWVEACLKFFATRTQVEQAKLHSVFETYWSDEDSYTVPHQYAEAFWRLLEAPQIQNFLQFNAVGISGTKHPVGTTFEDISPHEQRDLMYVLTLNFLSQSSLANSVLVPHINHGISVMEERLTEG